MKSLKKLEENNIRYTVFNEADLEFQATAIATEPVFGSTRLLFKNLQVLKPQELTYHDQ